jgi:pimeloyl-ACP methyl ester carboxylesterase
MILFERHFGSGEPLIILHGLFGQSDNWTSIARKLGEQFNVYTLDLRNHGQSGHDNVMNYDVMADDLLETIDYLGIQKMHLIGHSMGGKVAMLFALKYPERLEKLIIADIGPRFYKPHHQKILQGLNQLDLDSLTSRVDAENELSHLIPDVGTRQFLLKNLYRNNEGGFSWRFNLPVITEEIDHIGEQLPSGICTTSTLFFHGGKSDYIIQSDYSEILNYFPNAEFQIMQGAGHWLHAENPNEFIRITNWWIN